MFTTTMRCANMCARAVPYGSNQRSTTTDRVVNVNQRHAHLPPPPRQTIDYLVKINGTEKSDLCGVSKRIPGVREGCETCAQEPCQMDLISLGEKGLLLYHRSCSQRKPEACTSAPPPPKQTIDYLVNINGTEKSYLCGVSKSIPGVREGCALWSAASRRPSPKPPECPYDTQVDHGTKKKGGKASKHENQVNNVSKKLHRSPNPNPLT